MQYAHLDKCIGENTPWDDTFGKGHTEQTYALFFHALSAFSRDPIAGHQQGRTIPVFPYDRRPRGCSQGRVQNDPVRLFLSPDSPCRQHGVVGNDGTNANHHGIGLSPQPLHSASGFFTGDPFGIPGRTRDTTV